MSETYDNIAGKSHSEREWAAAMEAAIDAALEARLARVKALLDEADTNRAPHTFPFVATDAIRAALGDIP